ncbi:hypothetical protein PGT21_004304 [Puccinia graminis f. sp. tritici]|uniref:Uncharacterized protein n=1 Tax=Puccinia graminis f. sp. tritici TaxID=56615 RepID=A0A5B0LYS4_PUCGR|nr:hypothetical protein PGT21_004304 [Puccinia graminis f. sp. tritici]
MNHPSQSGVFTFSTSDTAARPSHPLMSFESPPWFPCPSLLLRESRTLAPLREQQTISRSEAVLQRKKHRFLVDRVGFASENAMILRGMQLPPSEFRVPSRGWQ